MRKNLRYFILTRDEGNIKIVTAVSVTKNGRYTDRLKSNRMLLKLDLGLSAIIVLLLWRLGMAPVGFSNKNEVNVEFLLV